MRLKHEYNVPKTREIRVARGQGFIFGFLSLYIFFPDGETPEEYDYKATSSFRMTTELRNRVNDVLKEFIGSRYYHNYTSGK